MAHQLGRDAVRVVVREDDAELQAGGDDDGLCVLFVCVFARLLNTHERGPCLSLSLSVLVWADDPIPLYVCYVMY